ncbi:MAG: OprD family outer membrane porin [Verrucomicrobiota bacterium]
MKKTATILATAMVASLASAGSAIDQLNELGYGTFSGKLQSLSMHRDYETADNHSTTLGLQLDYMSPEKKGWSIGASYIGAGVLASQDYDAVANPGEALIANGRNNVLNEAFLQYNMEALGLTNTTAIVGRKVNNGEVFRANGFRHKERSLEGIMLDSRDIQDTHLLAGHVWEMSSWQATGDRWKFENFDNAGVDGVTWVEAVNNSIEGLEVAAFDAVAWDVVNLIGARAKFDLGEEKKTSILAYLRHEQDIGQNAGHDATAFGLSIAQELGQFSLEGGFFSVAGDNLVFEEGSTGINHALGSLMMIYANQFNGGADTVYLKTTTKVEKTNTKLYGIYSYTQHDEDKLGATQRHGQELNIVATQPIPKIDNLTAALKVGMGYRDGINGEIDQLGTDTRLFITYKF